MSRRRKPRTLTDSEAELWAQVAATMRRRTETAARETVSEPLAETAREPDAPRPRPPDASAWPAAAGDRPSRSLRPTGRPTATMTSFDPAPGPHDRLSPTAAGLDKRTAQKLRKGLRAPEARLDLHGMTAERAHAALVGFIRSSHVAGKRCVLVITGKGGRIGDAREDAPFMPERTGVLRHSAPRWLAAAPLRALIVGVFPAHRRHGGEGAFYVYLKKIR